MLLQRMHIALGDLKSFMEFPKHRVFGSFIIFLLPPPPPTMLVTWKLLLLSKNFFLKADMSEDAKQDKEVGG